MSLDIPSAFVRVIPTTILWNLSIPPRTTLFLWRACKDESIVHALMFCPAAVAMWFSSPLGLRCDGLNCASFFRLDYYLKSVLDKDQMGIVAIISASI